ncbi:hypothetical protein F3Y22_tig00110328pilonHSYRG00774 [Hibiscus syriacus]|uniref:Uncharacterized protein n=1 Tax=Hibiscus syriacus TaxID=106335 RepID=A0A6A3B4B4_HIBSY|nr:hypothetical protein F3Y22_tig00110328pilonHSYRG00774 [Hibiscus syriacus]
MDCEGGLVMMDRAEIYTTAPFNPVKEAVAFVRSLSFSCSNSPPTSRTGSLFFITLFIHGEKGPSRLGTVTTELEKARERVWRNRRQMMEFEMEDVKIAPGSASMKKEPSLEKIRDLRKSTLFDSSYPSTCRHGLGCNGSGKSNKSCMKSWADQTCRCCFAWKPHLTCQKIHRMKGKNTSRMMNLRKRCKSLIRSSEGKIMCAIHCEGFKKLEILEVSR